MHDTQDHHAFHDGLIEGVNPLSLELFSAFRKAMHLQKQLFTRRLAESGTHPGQMVCLWALTEEGITQRDLAERLHLARPTVTVMLQKMERAGLIERNVDETDQRFTRIKLTDAGRAMREETRQLNSELFNVTIGRLEEKDQREMVRILRLLAVYAEEALAELPAGRTDDETGTAGDEMEGR